MSRTAPLVGWLAVGGVLVLTPTLARAQGIVSLPRTGQATVFSAGDDGDVQAGVVWPTPRFVAGVAGVLVDTLTGLQWTANANAPGPSACGAGTTKRWQEALDYVACLNSQAYLSFTDWRLPNINELYSLWNYHAGSPGVWLQGQGFTGVQGTPYWSSTTEVFNTNNAWLMKVNAAVGTGAKTSRFPTWPVRGITTGPSRVWRTGQTTSFAAGDDGATQAGEAWPNPRFVVGGECVTDTLTGLMWPRHPDSTLRIWQDGVAYANDLDLCGYTDWRLANVAEARSLQHYGTADSAAWLSAQGLENTQQDRYWTSTTAYNRTDEAWVVNLWHGWVFPLTNLTHASVESVNQAKTLRRYVLAVRTVGSPPPYHILTTTKAGTGSGTVTSADGAIDCGTACAKRYAVGTLVSLTASAEPGSTFTGWSGDPDCADGQVTLAHDTRCVATFHLPPPQHIVGVVKIGSGAGTVKTADGFIRCGVDCSGLYRPGATVTLVAIPDVGSMFAGWSGDPDCADGRLTVDAPRACTAAFDALSAAQRTLLPRTGQSTVYVPTDDGDVAAGVQWPSPRFTIAGECATDELTGLMWFRGPDQVGRRWPQALAYASNFSACGFSDWRLPNANELHAVLTSGSKVDSAWNAAGLSLSATWTYWSSTTLKHLASHAWALEVGEDASVHGTDKRSSVGQTWPVRGTAVGPARVFQTGQTDCVDSNGTAVPCAGTGQDGDVRAGVAWPTPRFVIQGECVTDTMTGLVWTRHANILAAGGIPEDGRRSWYEALEYSKTATPCGFSDWRIPNRSEFWSLSNRSVTNNAAWLMDQGFSNLELDAYWTSTTNPTHPLWAVAAFPMNEPWGHPMFDKSATGTGASYVWLVRTGAEEISYPLTVNAVIPGSAVPVVVSPPDRSGQGDGTTSMNRLYAAFTVVSLTAPASAAGRLFATWQRDGVDIAATPTVRTTIDGPHVLTAVYREPAPVVSTVSPSAGPLAGGTSVMIAGVGFAAGATVTFGGTAATSVTWVSATRLMATTPAHVAGPVNVTVTNPGGSSGTATGGFTYLVRPTFTDDPLSVRTTTIHAVHVLELRQRIDDLRARHGLATFEWTDLAIVPGATVVKAIHLVELRAALAQACMAAGLAVPTWTPVEVSPRSTPITAAQIAELRGAILAMW